ncbi:MAG: hypothetical protein FWE71_07485 [Nocardioidaceae bacterium]|nr:hypothetical protein [Nocardioidaceae bacterium]MCL2611830.1 hypothetical protein [Nocardioidaceae bacterium]
MDGTTRPTWLVEECPSWCVRDHRESDHPEDRYHHGEASLVPVVLARDRFVPASASLEATDLVVCRGRHVGDAVEWVVIEPAESPQPRLVLTRESAGSVARALEEQLRKE